MSAPALQADDVVVSVSDVSGTRRLVDGVTWTVQRGEHWVLLGPNGAGKSTLLGVLGARRHPSSGAASVLGRRLGRTDVRDLWGLVGHVDATLAARFNARLRVEDVVLTGASGTIQPRWSSYDEADRARRASLMELMGTTRLEGQALASCSAGERQRVLIARALMPQPALLLLDEPCTGLDLPSREVLLGALAELAAAHGPMATVTVTHHVEEIPSHTTHALLLAGGRVVARGPVGATLTSERLSECFGLPVTVDRNGERYAARAA